MEAATKYYSIPLPSDEVDYLSNKGYKIATIVKILVRDFVKEEKKKEE
jgi:hypothetical protein